MPDIGRCVNDAIEVYKKNWLVLVLAAIIFEVLMLITIFILAGPLSGGYAKMSLNALRREDKTVDMGDLFGCFSRFGRLFGLFFLTFLATLIGCALFIIPGIALMTIWLFPVYLVVDRDLRLFESLGVSQNVVTRKGLGGNLLLVIVTTIICIAPSAIPYVGFVVAWFVTPIAWLMTASAYIQEVDEDDGALADLFPQTGPMPGDVPDSGGEDQWGPVS